MDPRSYVFLSFVESELKLEVVGSGSKLHDRRRVDGYHAYHFNKVSKLEVNSAHTYANRTSPALGIFFYFFLLGKTKNTVLHKAHLYLSKQKKPFGTLLVVVQE